MPETPETYSLDIEVGGPLQVFGWPAKGIPTQLADDPNQWQLDSIRALVVNVRPPRKTPEEEGPGAEFIKTAGLAFLHARRMAPRDTMVVTPQSCIWRARIEADDAKRIASVGKQERLRLRVTFHGVRAGQFVGLRSRARVLL